MNKNIITVSGAALTLLTISLILTMQGRPVKGEELRKNELVILLHGLGRTDRSMETMSNHLQAAGFSVINLHYPSTGYSIRQLCANHLDPAIEQAARQYLKINFVTHSMGGIIVRYYLANHPEKISGRIVMLAPPNKGSEVVDQLGCLSLFQKIMGPAADQLSTSPSSIPNQISPINAEIGIIAGSRSYNPIFSSFIPGEDDGKVSVASTKLNKMSDHLTLPVSHTFIMNDRRVLQQTVHFLANGKFDR